MASGIVFSSSFARRNRMVSSLVGAMDTVTASQQDVPPPHPGCAIFLLEIPESLGSCVEFVLMNQAVLPDTRSCTVQIVNAYEGAP